MQPSGAFEQWRRWRLDEPSIATARQKVSASSADGVLRETVAPRPDPGCRAPGGSPNQPPQSSCDAAANSR